MIRNFARWCGNALILIYSKFLVILHFSSGNYQMDFLTPAYLFFLLTALLHICFFTPLVELKLTLDSSKNNCFVNLFLVYFFIYILLRLLNVVYGEHSLVSYDYIFWVRCGSLYFKFYSPLVGLVGLIFSGGPHVAFKWTHFLKLIRGIAK